jgi:hypothetical protein
MAEKKTGGKDRRRYEERSTAPRKFGILAAAGRAYPAPMSDRA